MSATTYLKPKIKHWMMTSVKKSAIISISAVASCTSLIITNKAWKETGSYTNVFQKFPSGTTTAWSPPCQYATSYNENAQCEHKLQNLHLTFEKWVPLVNGHPLSLQGQELQEVSHNVDGSTMKVIHRINRLYHFQL